MTAIESDGSPGAYIKTLRASVVKGEITINFRRRIRISLGSSLVFSCNFIFSFLDFRKEREGESEISIIESDNQMKSS